MVVSGYIIGGKALRIKMATGTAIVLSIGIGLFGWFFAGYYYAISRENK